VLHGITRYRRATKFAAASKSGFKNVKVCRIAEGCCSAPDLERYFLIHVMSGGSTASALSETNDGARWGRIVFVYVCSTPASATTRSHERARGADARRAVCNALPG